MKKPVTTKTTGLVCAAATVAAVSGSNPAAHYQHHSMTATATPSSSLMFSKLSSPSHSIDNVINCCKTTQTLQTNKHDNDDDKKDDYYSTRHKDRIRNYNSRTTNNDNDVILLKRLIRKVRGGATTDGGGGKDDDSSSPSSKKNHTTKKKKSKKKTSTKLGEEKKSATAKEDTTTTSSSTKQSHPSTKSTSTPTPSNKKTSTQSTSKTTPSSAKASKDKVGNNDKSSSSNPEQQEQNKQQQHRESKIVQEILNHGDDYYGILGISKTATSVEIQKAYRRRAVQTHPDKMSNGDRQAFDKVAEAYDVLSDETKRTMYNQYGKAGLQQGGGGGGGSPTNVEEMFRSFFGSGGSGSGPSQFRRREPSKPRNRTVRYQLEVTLEELYQGITRNVIVTQQQQQQGGRGYHHQQQQPHKRVEVHIPKGYASGQSIVLSGEMDTIKDATPADLVFMLAQRKHPIFTRKGHDLAMEVTITLEEAICGVQRTFRHLDGRMVSISSAEYDHTTERSMGGGGDTTHNENTNTAASLLIQDGDVQVLKGEGMPKPHTQEHHHGDNGDGTTSEYGDLYIQFRVEMPSATAMQKNLNKEERTTLQQLLEKLQGSPKPKYRFSDHQDMLPLQPGKTSDFGRASGVYRMDQPNVGGDEHLDDEEYGHSRGGPFPFGGGGRGFSYFSSSSFGGGPGSAFFGQQYSDDDVDDDGNVQCQQM